MLSDDGATRHIVTALREDRTSDSSTSRGKGTKKCADTTSPLLTTVKPHIQRLGEGALTGVASPILTRQMLSFAKTLTYLLEGYPRKPKKTSSAIKSGLPRRHQMRLLQVSSLIIALSGATDSDKRGLDELII